MKCRACDCILSDYEAVRKDSHGEFIDLCYACDSDSFQVREEINYIVQREDDATEEE